MDDIIITGTNTKEIDEFISVLCKTFSCKDLEVLRYFLGIEFVDQGSSTILSQERYIRDILHRYKLNGVDPSSTLMVQLPKVCQDIGETAEDVTLYRKMVGFLQYLT